jgi:hypothetical protein
MPKKGTKIVVIKAQHLDEIERIRMHLREHLKKSGLDRGTVAEKAGMTASDLDRVLDELTLDLEYGRLICIIRAVDVAPGTFFAELYGLARR